MLNIFKKFTVAFTFLFSTQALSAGIASSSEIEYVRIDKSGQGFVKFKTPLTYQPATCTSDNYKNMLAFNTNNPEGHEGGSSIYSTLLMAYAAGKKVHAVGTGTCDIYSQIETWAWGYPKD